MHIAFFTDGYLPQLNGVAASIDLLARSLDSLGQQVSIFAPEMGSYRDTRPGVYRLPSFKVIKDPPLWLAAPVSARVLRVTAHMDLDIVHSHSPFALHALAYQVARRKHLPLVYTYHTLLPAHVKTAAVLGRTVVSPRLAELYSVWTSDLCDRVIAPSEKIRDLLIRFGVKRPISVVHNGIDLSRFQGAARGLLRKRLGLPEDARIMLAVGRLTPEKNIGFLVDVLARVHACAPNVYLVPVGQGPLRELYRKQAEHLGVGENLVFSGPIPPSEMPQVYADADVYVSASFSEAHSIAALEALASGLPLVVVPDQSLAMMVTEGENGFVVDLDKEAFAGAVLRILAAPGLQEQMHAESRRISGQFSIQAQARELAELYADLIEKFRKRQSHPS